MVAVDDAFPFNRDYNLSQIMCSYLNDRVLMNSVDSKLIHKAMLLFNKLLMVHTTLYSFVFTRYRDSNVVAQIG